MLHTRTGLFSILFFAVLCATHDSAFAGEVIVMGYRITIRAPLINKAPESSGLYKDLFKEAARRINCRLQIVRNPKMRVLNKMKTGAIDFYPGFNFTIKRSKTIFYIENGLPGGDIGISSPALPEITDLRQLKGKTLLVALGGADHLHNTTGVHQGSVPDLSIEKAVKLIKLGRFHFYIYNKSSLEYYLKLNKPGDIKVHHNCCGGIKPMYLGFSRKSKHIKEENNPDYDSTKEVSINNFPTRLAPDCLASRLEKALKQMKESGFTDKLYNKYYSSQ